MELLVAFATDNGENLKNDGHYGDAAYYIVYKMSEEDSEFVKNIENPKFVEKHHGDPNKAKGMTGLLKDIDVLVGGQFGTNITRMIQKFVCVIPRVESITESIEKVQHNFDKVIKEKNSEKRKPIIISK
ncbi:dinitrogenase iron-molybdenum cofactor biosynthesis protein [bacterium]|nr:dinitrogenase iron-molybdenum cofactor biosynthesis protein [bacterium]